MKSLNIISTFQCVRVGDSTSEEVLDERSDQFHPELDVAVRPLKRGADHLRGPLVQDLLLLRGGEFKAGGCSVNISIHHHYFLWLKKENEPTSCSWLCNSSFRVTMAIWASRSR